MYVLGDFSVGDVIYFPFDTYDSNGGSVTISGFAVTDIEAYKNGSTTVRASDNGYALLDTDGIDFNGVVGLHGFSINTGDNSDAGFWSAGGQFWINIDAITVDGQTVRFTYYFTLGRLLKPTTAGRTLTVDAAGGVDVTAISGDAPAADNLESILDGTGGTMRLLSATATPALRVESTHATGVAAQFKVTNGAREFYANLGDLSEGAGGGSGALFVASHDGVDFASVQLGRANADAHYGINIFSSDDNFAQIAFMAIALASDLDTESWGILTTNHTQLGPLTVGGALDVTGAFTAIDAGNDIRGIDVAAISGDATAADNLKLFFDGTGYAGGTTKLLVQLADGVDHGGSTARLELGSATATPALKVGSTYQYGIAAQFITTHDGTVCAAYLGSLWASGGIYASIRYPNNNMALAVLADGNELGPNVGARFIGITGVAGYGEMVCGFAGSDDAGSYDMGMFGYGLMLADISGRILGNSNSGLPFDGVGVLAQLADGVTHGGASADLQLNDVAIDGSTTFAGAVSLNSTLTVLGAVLFDDTFDVVHEVTMSDSNHINLGDGLAQFFSKDTGLTYSDAIDGSVVKEIADNANASLVTGIAINKLADSFVDTTVVVASGDYQDTFGANQVYHQLQDDAGTLDCYYEFDVGAGGIPVSATVIGRVNGPGDSIKVSGYRWADDTWVQLATIPGQGGSTDGVVTGAMFASMVGTGVNAGKVRVRFHNTGLSSANLYIDQLWVGYASNMVKLTSDGVDEVMVSGAPNAMNLRQWANLAGAALFGKVDETDNGDGTWGLSFLDIGDGSTPRITGTVTEDGDALDRTSVTYSLPS